MIKTLLRLMLLFLIGTTVFGANHSDGLHVQIADKVIDIRPADVTELQTFQTDPQHVSIMVRLNERAAKKLTIATESCIGASMVWIWNGRVLGMQQISQPLTSDLTIHHFKPEEAEDFRQRTHLKSP